MIVKPLSVEPILTAALRKRHSTLLYPYFGADFSAQNVKNKWIKHILIILWILSKIHNFYIVGEVQIHELWLYCCLNVL